MPLLADPNTGPSRSGGAEISLLRGELSAFVAKPSYLAGQRLSRRIEALDRSAHRELAPRRIRVALGGNCNLDFFRPAFIATLAAEGFDADCESTNFDSWVAAVLSKEVTADWWVVWLSAMGASRGGLERREFDLPGLKAAASALWERGKHLLLILPEALPWEDDAFSPFTAWRRELLRSIEAATPAAIHLPVEQVQRALGNASWHAPRYWSLAKNPCHPDAAAQVAATAGQTLSLATRPRVKAVLVDLDDTLWGGIVGDAGAGGLSLDPDGEGRPYLELQRFLKDLSGSGVPVCIVSKNEAEHAESPFAQRPEMILQRSDIVYFEASWEPKYLAIQRIAKQLNLGLDSICYLDDSPFERNEVRAVLPDVIVPELPAMPEERVPALLRSGLFSQPVKRDEDIRRVQFYRQEAERHASAVGAADHGQYLRSLGMKLAVHRISGATLSRAESLVQKTNQFNVTNRRLTAAQIAQLAADETKYAYCATLSDRFGDSGIVAVLIAHVCDGAGAIDEWVMSCRVFGRGVEDALLEHFVHWLKRREALVADVEFLPTDKNSLVPEVLVRLGFVVHGEAGERSRWQLRLPVTTAHFITITGNS